MASLLDQARLVVDTETTSVGGVHETGGLPGWLALDVMAPHGSPVVAPEAGTFDYWTGHDPALGVIDPATGVFGWSAHFTGRSGQQYFITHLGEKDVAANQPVLAGQQIGTVGDFPAWRSSDHAHWAPQGSDPVGVLGRDYAAMLGTTDPGGGTGSGGTGSTPTPATGGGSSDPATVAACASVAQDIISGKISLADAQAAHPECGFKTGGYPGSSAVDAAMTGVKALGFLFSMRGLELLAGVGLVLVGVAMLARAQLARPQVTV